MAEHGGADVQRWNGRLVVFRLWLGLLGPPLAWAAQLVLSDGFSELGCRSGGFSALTLVLVAITVAALGASIGCGLVAWRLVREARDDAGTGAARERAEFLALGGVWSSALFSILIAVGGFLPHVFLPTCGR